MLPLQLGRDLSGTVESVGAQVAAFGEGEAVYAMLGDIDRGSYAEYVLVKPNEAAPKPARLSHIEAAAVPLAALTAWQGLFDHVCWRARGLTRRARPHPPLSGGSGSNTERRFSARRRQPTP
jgi:NADPH:quinone reductase-like Zn-dependent oxidoreductase